MRKAALALCASLTAAACGGGDLSAPANASLDASSSLGAVYALTAINGHALPCCSHVTSDGKTEQWASSAIHFTTADTYTWTVELRFDSELGPQYFNTEIVDSLVSAGHYAHEGNRIVFADSTTSRVFSATLVNDTIAVTYAGSTYRFRPVPPPGVSASQWAQSSCNDVAGDDPGCPVADASGVVTTTLGGMLEFDYNVAAGHYASATEYQYRHPDGTTETRQVTSSTGTYRWDGTTVTLTDSATGATMTGQFDGSPGRLRVQSGASVFGFFRLIQLPPGTDRRPR